MAEGSNRQKVIEAFLSLLAEKSFEKITLSSVSERAGIPLADMRKDFGSTFDMVAAFMRDTDSKVLAGGTAEDAQATKRDRLFDVLMRRFEVLLPHRDAVRSLARSSVRHPRFGLAMNKLAVRSQQWMLSAAGIDSSGVAGGMRAQAVSVLFARVMRTWLNDDDPGLAKTMAELDRELASGERLLILLDDICRFVPRCRRPLRKRENRSSRHAPGSEPGAMQV